jgi:hypothetical protein
MMAKVRQTALPELPCVTVEATRGTPEHDYLMMHIDGEHSARQMVHEGRRCLVVEAEQQAYPYLDTTVFQLQVVERITSARPTLYASREGGVELLEKRFDLHKGMRVDIQTSVDGDTEVCIGGCEEPILVCPGLELRLVVVNVPT